MKTKMLVLFTAMLVSWSQAFAANSPDADHSIFWKNLVLGVAVIIATLIAFFGARLYAENSRRNHNQENAKQLLDECLKIRDRFGNLYNTVLSGANDESLPEWQRQTLLVSLTAAKSRFDSANLNFQVAYRDENDPRVDKRSADEYGGMVQCYSRISEDMQWAIGMVRRIEGLLKRPDNIVPDPGITPDHPDFASKNQAWNRAK